ncbi:MAG TPA: sulfotransferase family 2 domain-containing protein [Verrucomicrobiae bacterium]|nr:sulfotransferase family 2 domain-containing protein [Verrucomicrobiae bacterium]
MIELISVHIPKCAGTSFSTVLHKIYGDRLLGDQVDQPMDPEMPFQKNFTAWKEEQDRKPPPPAIRAIHGHFWAGKYDRQAPKAKRITWLRHPIKRLLSHYYFWLSKPELPHSLHKHVIQNKLSLIEFAQLPQLQNLLHNIFLRGRSLDEFHFVGISEHFQEDLDDLARQMGWPKQQMTKERPTVHKDYKPDGLDTDTEKKLRALNEADLALYETALQMRARRIATRN